jgi:hypothetical protein
MSRLRQYILRASLEDETGAETPIIEDDGGSLEAGVAEVLAADQEVCDAGEAVEDLGEVHATLESIKLSVESAIADGGLTPREAEFFRHAMDASSHRVGLRDNLPSLESFGGSSDREKTTRIALEGVVEQIKKIWAAIVATLKRWWETVERFFYKAFGAAPRLYSRATALKKDAAASSKAIDEGATIKASGVHGELLGGNPSEAANELKAVAEDVLKTYSSAVTTYAEGWANKLRSITEEDFSKVASGAEIKVGTGYPVPGVCNVEGNPSEYGVHGNHAVKTTKPMPGGKILVTIFPKPGATFSGFAGQRDYFSVIATSKSFISEAKGHTAAEEKEHAPLNKEAVLAIANAVQDMAGAALRYKSTWEASKKVKQALEAAGEEYSKKDFSKLEGESASLATDLPKLIAGLGKELDSAQRSFLGYALSMGQTLVQIGEKSLKHHNGKTKEPTAPPAAAAPAPAPAAAPAAAPAPAAAT